jgi:hypothetical protein
VRLEAVQAARRYLDVAEYTAWNQLLSWDNDVSSAQLGPMGGLTRAAAEQRRQELHERLEQRAWADAGTQAGSGPEVSPTSLPYASTGSAARLVELSAVEREAALGEIQSLARELGSKTLASSDLAVAVEELAESFPVPVEVRVHSGRFSHPVEAIAYLVIRECLTDMARAGATWASVVGEVSSGALLLRIEADECRGPDQATARGLVGLSDGVVALGGALRVDDPAGGGTRVDVIIPFPASPTRQSPST